MAYCTKDAIDCFFTILLNRGMTLHLRADSETLFQRPKSIPYRGGKKMFKSLFPSEARTGPGETGAPMGGEHISSLLLRFLLLPLTGGRIVKEGTK